MNIEYFYILAYIIYGISCGFFCVNIAKQKDLEIGRWFWSGFFFGIIAVIAVSGSSDRSLKNHLIDIKNALNKMEVGPPIERKGLFK
jgi:hypothetical protein